MPKAILNGVVIAESNDTIMVENNHYFPPESLKQDYFTEASKTTVCGWKGTSNYFDIVVEGQTAQAAAWTYKEPKDAAKEIKNYVAFWGAVSVES